MLDLCLDFFDQNRVCFDFVLDLKLLRDSGSSVEKLHLLDFQGRNISRASRTGRNDLFFHICLPGICETQLNLLMFQTPLVITRSRQTAKTSFYGNLFILIDSNDDEEVSESELKIFYDVIGMQMNGEGFSLLLQGLMHKTCELNSFVLPKPYQKFSIILFQLLM